MERFKRIKRFLRRSDSGRSISEIHEVVGSEVSRKTIQRDIAELLLGGEIRRQEGSHGRYEVIEKDSFEVTLTASEIDYILSNMSPVSPIYIKLRDVRKS